MDSSILLGITTFTYLSSSLLYLCLLLFKKERIGKVATVFTVAAFIIQTAGIALRWHESYRLEIGHAPLTNMYESIVFFAWTIILIYLLIERKFKIQTIGAFAVPIAFLAMAYASLSDDSSKNIAPLIPALQSNWLITHVVTCFIGYASFAISAGLGIMYLLKQHFNTSTLLHSLPSLKILDDIIHKSIIVGFLWLTCGIVTGSVWANTAWGSYWSWDVKETWSLITWFIYAITLHIRYTIGWSGKRIAWLSILGFISVLFTYFGVNFWLVGLHSYASI